MTIARLRDVARRRRVQIEAAALALFALAAFLVLGVSARRRIEVARRELSQLTSASSEIARFRSAYAAPTADESARTAHLPDSIAISVPRELRVTLAERLASDAERQGLGDVRVRFTGPDSAAAPPRPELVAASVGPADYTVTIDCTGGLSSVLALINRLPPSVALQRLTASRAAKHGTAYHLVLAVFESAAGAQHG